MKVKRLTFLISQKVPSEKRDACVEKATALLQRMGFEVTEAPNPTSSPGSHLAFREVVELTTRV
jgi:hypothetical protein